MESDNHATWEKCEEFFDTFLNYCTYVSLHIAKGVDFLKENTARELARWTAAIDTLLMQGYKKIVGIKNKIYAVTNDGYTFADQIKEEFNIDTSKDFGEYLVD